MKVLIIEDSNYKTEGIRAIVGDCGIASEIEVARSFQTALRAIKEFCPELMILDMCLPTSESKDGELEGRYRIYGGEELLAEMEFANIQAKVIVITQFERFEEGKNSRYFESLLLELQKRYPMLLAGGVHFSAVNNIWQDELRTIVKKLIFAETM